jgi:hypothetical protein
MEMSRAIAINGKRLDEVRMPVEPHDPRVVSYLTYPASQLRFSRGEGAISLVVPAYLAVEL